MRAYHNSRVADYRTPYGALPLGDSVELSIDIWDEPEAQCTCRVWIDGKGEQLFPMEKRELSGHLRFKCTLTPEEPELIWYSFIIKTPEGEWRCGAKDGHTGGESVVKDWEPASFQITVYKPRKVPDWYKNGVVYQIFPDRFCRGEDWRELAEEALSEERSGPGHALCEDWYSTPCYEKDENGRVTRWDFYGGTLSGIKEKLGYLKGLGVTVIYLNPIFKASSNHRYDTGDYMKVDPMLGGDEAFEELVRAADEQGISIILDGVFNHTGCDSRYFNKYENYDSLGAWQSKRSPYRSWYRFDDSPAGYECWWGVDDLPNLEENDPRLRELIFAGKDSVVRHWLRKGAKGWRLDVADELPDDFIAGIKSAVTDVRPEDGLLLGEVWEDASNKISYGKLRRYLLGSELDSAMNYPLLDALHGFILGKLPAEALCETLESLKENYPPEAFYSSLNLMGSHDRPRIMTIMGGAPDAETLTEEERKSFRLSDGARGLAKGRIWLMTLIQMTMPGVPCIYYGDEAGLEGYADPYNRGAFPWGREDTDLTGIYRNAVSLRRLYPVFISGDFEPFYDGENVFGFFRDSEDGHAAVLVNRSISESRTVTIPARGGSAAELVGGIPVTIEDGKASLTLGPMGSAVILFLKKESLGAPMPKGAGVLCHITSVPNRDGPGNIGKPAMEFVDFLASAGQKYWQILPVNPTDEHGSPYAGASAFAANISLLPEDEEQLRELFSQFVPEADYALFCAENSQWLVPYAAFTALRRKFGGKMWKDWPEKYRHYDPVLLQEPEIFCEAEFQKFCQFRFETMWKKLRAYAKEKGVMIIGDLPMYVSEDSADVWAQPELFTVDGDGHTTSCAGVPPDYFAKDGQHWGNPLYRWDVMKDNGYDWWMRRLQRVFSLYDYVRLDHFRGFESYWSIPAGERASKGAWLFGPGTELFEKARSRFGPLPVLAEDLGLITPAVRGLVASCGFPGTDVLQFYNGDPLSEYIPPEGKIAYSGTHDNQTLIGWCMERYPELDPAEAAQKLMDKVLESRAEVAILPLQDVLGLDDSARMNTPGTTGTNWTWQAKKEGFKDAGARLLKSTIKTNRSDKNGRME
ncbi:MAG: 4-alpha-glucanotransferase [Oscillospiraceae bacterium]